MKKNDLIRMIQDLYYNPDMAHVNDFMMYLTDFVNNAGKFVNVYQAFQAVSYVQRMACLLVFNRSEDAALCRESAICCIKGI